MTEGTRTLTEREMRQVEQWAEHSNLADMLSFVEGLPRFFVVPRQVLLGSNNKCEILVEGLTTRHRVVSAIANLDEPFNPTLNDQRILMAKRRSTPSRVMEPVYRELSKGFEKICLASGLGGCGGKIVNAHTVQKAAFQAHAQSGHVYEINAFKSDPDRASASLVGINRATTVTAFCERHDSGLFRCIEIEPFESKSQQFFMYHYRAVAQAFYDRIYKCRFLEVAYEENSKLPDIGSLASLSEHLRSIKLDAEDLQKHKTFYEKQLVAENWSSVEGYAWTGTRAPDLFSSDFFGPGKDFQGRTVQDRKSFWPLRWISLTVTAAPDGKALVLLCAERGSPLLATCVASLRKTPRDRRTMAVVNYVICHTDNFIMLPHWWDRLGVTTQQLFVNACTSKYFPRKLPHVCEWRLSEVRD